MLGETIKKRRLEKGLSQEEVAERLFVVRQTVSKWEKGLSLPDSEMLLKLAEALDVSAAELLESAAPAEEAQQPAIKPSKRWRVWEIVLLALGSPIWLSLGIAVFAVILSLYVSWWAVIVSLWAVFAAFAGCSVGGVLACAVFVAGSNGASGVVMLAVGIVCAGLAILSFYGCKAATEGTLILTKKMAVEIKNRFIRKENA